MNIRFSILICLIVAPAPHLNSQGILVPNGITYAGLNPAGGYEIQVLQNPSNGDFTGFWLIPRGKTPPSSPFVNAFSYDGYIDEGVRVYVVASNQPLSLQPILADAYPEFGFGHSYVFPDNSPFYVGLYTGPRWSQFPPTDPITYADPLFGWARLVNNQGVIQMLDSALEYGGGGIYAGTQTIIPAPEPGTLRLTVLVTILLISVRWRARSPTRTSQLR